MFYHGVITTCNGFRYSMGAAILDKDNPAKLLYRTREYLLAPAAPYELAGDVPNVVFPCAALQDGERVAVYYGAAEYGRWGLPLAISARFWSSRSAQVFCKHQAVGRRLVLLKKKKNVCRNCLILSEISLQRYCMLFAVILQSRCSATAKPLQRHCKADAALLQSCCSATAK